MHSSPILNQELLRSSGSSGALRSIRSTASWLAPGVHRARLLHCPNSRPSLLTKKQRWTAHDVWTINYNRQCVKSTESRIIPTTTTTNKTPQQVAQANRAPQQHYNPRGRGGRVRGGRGRGRGQNQNAPKVEADANMAQQLADVTAQLNAFREQNNNNNNHIRQQEEPAPQRNDDQRHVHFQEEQPPFGIAGNNEEEDADDNNDGFEEGKFLLDSVASPSHVNCPMSNTNPLPQPITVSTPNGPLSLNSSTELDLQLPYGILSTEALVNPNMGNHLISPISIITQHGPLVLTETAAAVLPRNDPITAKEISKATPIASVRNGLYVLHTPSLSKPTSRHFIAMGAVRPKPRKTIKPVKPITAVVIPSPNTKKRKAQSIGIGISNEPPHRLNYKLKNSNKG